MWGRSFLWSVTHPFCPPWSVTDPFWPPWSVTLPFCPRLYMIKLGTMTLHPWCKFPITNVVYRPVVVWSFVKSGPMHDYNSSSLGRFPWRMASYKRAFLCFCVASALHTVTMTSYSGSLRAVDEGADRAIQALLILAFGSYTAAAFMSSFLAFAVVESTNSTKTCMWTVASLLGFLGGEQLVLEPSASQGRMLLSCCLR